MPDEKKLGILHDDQLDARINITDPISIDTLVEVDPWTQRWKEIAEEEQQSKKETH